jgi:hypothetical protein
VTEKPLALHPRFRQVGLADSVVAANRYVFINALTSAPGPPESGGGAGAGTYSGGTLIDEQTGRHTIVRGPGCYGTLAGGSWLLFYYRR